MGSNLLSSCLSLSNYWDHWYVLLHPAILILIKLWSSFSPLGMLQWLPTVFADKFSKPWSSHNPHLVLPQRTLPPSKEATLLLSKLLHINLLSFDECATVSPEPEEPPPCWSPFLKTSSTFYLLIPTHLQGTAESEILGIFLWLSPLCVSPLCDCL